MVGQIRSCWKEPGDNRWQIAFLHAAWPSAVTFDNLANLETHLLQNEFLQVGLQSLQFKIRILPPPPTLDVEAVKYMILYVVNTIRSRQNCDTERHE